MIKTYVYPADFFGCGHYRLVWPSHAVQRMFPDDFDITIVEPGNGPNALKALMVNRKVAQSVFPPDADLIILQRPTQQYLTDSIPLMRKAGVAVIVDIDDDLTSVHPSNPAWLHMHPKTSSGHTWHSVSEGCKVATVCTVSSVQLTNRYGAGNAVMLRNCVPEDYLRVEHQDSTVIAWAGSLHSHPGDLRVVGPTIRQLVDAGEQFMVVGDGTGGARELNLREDPPFPGSIPFNKWASAVSQIGIGIAPLQDTKFNAAKSWLKPLEYSATGVPWVASPRAEYAAFADEGVGLLAERPREWIGAIKRLINDDALRAEQSKLGREVAARWTYEVNAWRWAEVWSAAVKAQRG